MSHWLLTTKAAHAHGHHHTRHAEHGITWPGLFAEACAASEDDSDVVGIFIARVATL